MANKVGSAVESCLRKIVSVLDEMITFPIESVFATCALNSGFLLLAVYVGGIYCCLHCSFRSVVA